MWNVLAGALEAFDLVNHWRFYAPCLGGLAIAFVIQRVLPEQALGTGLAFAIGATGFVVGLVWELHS